MKCNKCGECCKFIVFRIGLVSDDVERWIRAHDIAYKEGYIRVEQRCRYLNINNLCSINERKPQICKNYFCETDKSPFNPCFPLDEKSIQTNLNQK